MNVQRGILRTPGILLFLVGTLTGLALAAISVMADVEAVYYGFDKVGQGRLPGLRCPVLMATEDAGAIRVTLHNPFDNPADLLVRADLSNPGPVISERMTVQLAPGEKKQVRWTVTDRNVDLRLFIFAQVATYPMFTYPFRAATCGIVVLPVSGFTGSMALGVLLGIIVLGLAGGLALWLATNRPLLGRAVEVTYAMQFLGGVVTLAVFFSVIAWWLLGALFVLLGILLLVVMLRYVLGE